MEITRVDLPRDHDGYEYSDDGNEGGPYGLITPVYKHTGGARGLYKVGLLGKETIHPDSNLVVYVWRSPPGH